jgi:hypothetical protein
MSDGQVSMETRVSRKPHTCVWCSWEIPARTRYRFQVYSYDGGLTNAHWHEACVEDSYEVFRGECQFEFSPGEGEQPFPGLTMIDRKLRQSEAQP